MTVTDPIGDMLTRVRNASQAGHDQVTIPASRLRLELAKLLKQEGFVQRYEVTDDQKQGQIKLTLKYGPRKRRVITGIKRVSKPGLRIYSGTREIAPVQGGLGVAVLSTSRGLMTDREARKQKLGGEVLCHVW